MGLLTLMAAEMMSDRRRRCAEEAGADSVLGMSCFTVTLRIGERASERAVGRSLERAARMLRALRAETICFREDFPYVGYFLKCGFKAASEAALIRAKAAEIAASAAKRRERVLISARRADADVLRAVGELCGSFRFLTVDVPALAMGAVCRDAERRGVSPSAVRRDGTVEADAAVFFDMPERRILLPEPCVTVLAGGGSDKIVGGRALGKVVFSVPNDIGEALPRGYSGTELLSSALEAGRLSPRDIKIVSAAGIA